MDSEITPQLREAVTDLLTYYDQMLDGGSGTLAQLARCVHKLRQAQPHPAGQIGADLAHIIKPAPTSTRIDHVEALERLRLLTRPGTNRP